MNAPMGLTYEQRKLAREAWSSTLLTLDHPDHFYDALYAVYAAGLRDANAVKAELCRALTLAQTALEQGQNINGHIAANGPTIGEVIARALAAAEKP